MSPGKIISLEIYFPGINNPTTYSVKSYEKLQNCTFVASWVNRELG